MYLVNLFKKIKRMVITYYKNIEGKKVEHQYVNAGPNRDGKGSWRIRILNGTIEVNGKTINDKVNGIVKIDVEGGVITELVTDASVNCQDVIGDIDAGGSVTAKKVTGSIDAGGSVNVTGGVGGNIDAGGSVNIIK